MSQTPTTKSRRHRARRGQGEALRAEILAAAMDLLAKTGHQEAVSVRAVAQLVGVTTPSIYMHFKDKDELLDAVCAEHFAALGRAMEQQAATESDPLERLLAQGRAYVRFALTRPEHYRLSTMIAGKPGSVDETIQDACFQQLLVTVDKCTKAGIFPEGPGNAVDVGLRLWAAVHGVASLLVCKPWLPWGDVDELIERNLRAAVVGSAVGGRPERLGELQRLGAVLQPLWSTRSVS
ncbi:MAG: TetR/AcrR family transcriptional regulator [Acidimicrobiales bacterium]|jgi:AcrR family transcriptional regulator